jgi:hypothetical protein
MHGDTRGTARQRLAKKKIHGQQCRLSSGQRGLTFAGREKIGKKRVIAFQKKRLKV